MLNLESKINNQYLSANNIKTRNDLHKQTQASFTGLNITKSLAATSKFIGNSLEKSASSNTNIVKAVISDLPNNAGKKAADNKFLVKMFKSIADIKPAKGIYSWFGNTSNFNNMANPIKDLVACGLYVQASLANKKIPAERRPFVATMDFVNGITNVSLQLLLAFTVQTKPVVGATTKLIFGKVTKSHYKAVKAGIGLVVATIFAKRILSYLISTPIATAMKDKFAPKKGTTSVETKPAEVKEQASKSSPDKALEQKTPAPAMLSTPKQSTAKSSDIFARFHQKKA